MREDSERCEESTRKEDMKRCGDMSNFSADRDVR